MKKSVKRTTKKKASSGPKHLLAKIRTIDYLLQVARDIAKDAAAFTNADQAWIMHLSPHGKQPRLVNAPKKVHVPLELPDGLVKWVSTRQSVLAWTARGKGTILTGRNIKASFKSTTPSPAMQKKIEADQTWLGGSARNKALLFIPLDKEKPALHILVLEASNWTENKIQSLAGFVAMASRTLDVAMHSRRLEKRLLRSAAISEIAQNINTTLDMEILLRLIVLEVTKALQCQAGTIWLAHEKREVMTLRSSLGLSDGLRRALEDTMKTRKELEGQDDFSQEYLEDNKDSRSSLLKEDGILSLVTVPLKTKNKVMGAIQLFAKHHLVFSKEDHDLLRTLANLAATALDNAYLLRESKRKAQELLSLYEVAQVVSEISNIKKALEHILERVSMILDVEKSWFMFYDRENQKLKAHETAVGAIEEQLEALELPINGEGVSPTVFRSSRPMFTNDAAEVPQVQHEFQGIFNLRNMMAVPLRGREETLGVFLVGNKRQGALFTGSDVRLFKTLASAATTVIQNANLYDKMRRSNMSLVEVISKMVDSREPYTRGHSQRVSEYAGAIARNMHLSLAEVERIKMAGLLHDIGKLGVGENLKFMACANNLIKPHVLIGAQMLDNVNFPWEVKTLVKLHHEHFDGSGYPDGLKNDAIPLGSRIIAVADAFDIAVSLKDGRQHSAEEGFKSLQSKKNTILDPEIVDLFIEIWPLISA